MPFCTTKDMERYVLMKESVANMDAAIVVLRELKSRRSPITVIDWAAFQWTLVCYAKGFKRSNGAHGRYQLPETLVPLAHREAHSKLLQLRDKEIAHNDLDYKRPQIAAHMSGGKRKVRIFRFTSPNEEAPSLVKIISCMRGVRSSILSEIRGLERQLFLDPKFKHEALHGDIWF